MSFNSKDAEQMAFLASLESGLKTDYSTEEPPSSDYDSDYTKFSYTDDKAV